MLTINFENAKTKKKLKNENYKLKKSDFSASTWKEYKDWLKSQLKEEKIKKKAQKPSKKKPCKTSKPKKLSYTDQLKDERWLEKRKEVLNTKGYVCCQCGSKYNLQIHHLRYEKGKMAWEYPMGDLIVLCEKCHETHIKIRRIRYIQNTNKL